MTPEQCRMARASLKWSIDDLAEAANVGRATVARYENGTDAKPETVDAIRSALRGAGIHFVTKGPFAGAVQRRLHPPGTP
jgi:transcriptional regulator with XRE-family HTH domain